MGRAFHRSVCTLAVLGVLLICGRAAYAAEADAPASVRVVYATGDTELDTLKSGVKFFSNRGYPLGTIPAALEGLTFTRRAGGKSSALTLYVTAGATVYLIVDSDKDKAPSARVRLLNQTLADSAWTRLDDVIVTAKPQAHGAIYQQHFDLTKKMVLWAAGFDGIVVAAKKLELQDAASKVAKKPDAPSGGSTLHTDPALATAAIAGVATHIASQQATIKSLEIYETEAGLMLGQTSEVVLTAMRGTVPTATAVRFVTPIGDDMSLSRDEALRFIRLTYPNWYVDKAEITFEDKYVAHDGGSIGAAVGTMILSVIQGFAIDPDIAITGDISANGKIRAIGGVSAKLRGAIDSKCTLVVIPTENYDQLVDAVTYGGLSTVTDIQVLGISTLNDAAAAVRTDRDLKLSEAIAIFATVQNSLKSSPDYLQRPDAAIKLAKVLELAPQHLSARVLLAVAQGKQPKTLSATASQYYTFLAARDMMAVLLERQESRDAHQVPSSVLRSGLADLHKLRPLADPKVRPLIDAFARFIQSWNDLQQGGGSTQGLESQRQSLLDEMTKENSDPQLMQKMLKEGM